MPLWLQKITYNRRTSGAWDSEKDFSDLL